MRYLTTNDIDERIRQGGTKLATSGSVFAEIAALKTANIAMSSRITALEMKAKNIIPGALPINLIS